MPSKVLLQPRVLSSPLTLRPRPVLTLPKFIYRAMSQAQVPTFGFSERKPSGEEAALIQDVLKLYQLQPVSAAYARYDQKATFHDPIGLAEGLESVKAQFNSMPKIFSKSETLDLKVLDNPQVKPPSVQFALAQNYHVKTPQTTKLVNSLITLTVDPSTKLITQ
ncbi:hypothetical protein TREMEDRAFT_66057 [Tremella mesenterica DSM 1558]|uniref:uncharacterized protein n=1 Tax=Tremella mesenterica (strain ATCC 24925 / CBS 8224 / DSM 1558 / NBRC 9311 / NRRL Y-6157 / RJB 2259-6 / UBC 559-6) TaxID=578456 RepID=UPI00032C3705|nr:uncharacterized protein TREMEDRAFT_66057 [Tremella mesenterica DSM 1558]EIW65968.1 hypothetical protein TREMEDRAFT_66057 [Tremella mesenterica DSM 1558]